MSEQPIIGHRVVKTGISDARANNAKTQGQYQPYKDAAWGFVNHWYPGLFSHGLVEDRAHPEEDVPPLADDLPFRFPERSEQFPHPFWPASPGVLNDNAMALGMHRTGFGNWQIACENGFDNAHILVLENEELGLKVEGLHGREYRTSVVPGVLMVENWPGEHLTQYEWYVPITDDTHEYWEIIVRVCKTPEERQKHQYRYDHVYKPLCLHGFNDCDIYAREAMQNFYADGTGWDDEQLVSTDISPISWRKLASGWNRGIAKPGRGVNGAMKDNSLIFKENADGHRPSYWVRQIEEH